jgi:hypothetical protein
MEKETRNAIERATQRVRRLLEEDFAAQLASTFDVLLSGAVAPASGAHLSAREVKQRERIVAAIAHKRAAGMKAAEAVADYVRDAAFTTLNRFAALKMLEARGLVRECVSKGEQSSGYREFYGLAPGVALLPEGAGYRLYVESLFDELSTEIKVLFDRRDPASVLWPRRATFADLLDAFNAEDLEGVWTDDETIGWVYQYFNSGDERRKMREASQAPRNSRELAVRNQFFTPRYVVEFLVDNTLGRTWLEMHGHGSRLAEQCRYFVRTDEEEARVRPRKDPRDMRILDPACGSGHFLLYAFDLLLTIYEEAWEAADGAPSEATGRTLREDHRDLDTLRLAVPALVVEHNLHGVDIDPRAAQIAALALWLRAQRAWKDLGVPAAQRPRISRTHVVVAEPMPGDEALVEEFAARLNPPLLRDLFRRMVAEMRLAGELGTLLPVEQSLAAEVTRAREQFVRQEHSPRAGFLPGLERQPAQAALDLSGIDDDGFFHEAESRLLDALREFAEAAASTAGGAAVRRRLFAGDAAQGIALIDLLRRRFDVVLMNPPFGAVSLGAKKEFDKAYPRTKNDVYAAFVERGVQVLQGRGLLGAITSRTGFFLTSFREWREGWLLSVAPPFLFADLGMGVMDTAVVEAAAFCLKRTPTESAVCLRLLDSHDKSRRLAESVALINRGIVEPPIYRAPLAGLRAIPGSPLAYWVPVELLTVFRDLPAFEDGHSQRAVRCGLGTLDDFRFLRLSWEHTLGGLDWLTYYHGGTFSRFYDLFPLAVMWAAAGREVKAFVEAKVGSASRKVQSEDRYLTAGFVFPRRTRALAAKVMPAGGIFSTGGQAGFAAPSELLATIALLNTDLCSFLISLTQGRTGDGAQFEVGLIKRLPWPRLLTAKRDLAELAQKSWRYRRGLHSFDETSEAFAVPAIVGVPGANCSERCENIEQGRRAAEAAERAIQAELNAIAYREYGLDGRAEVLATCSGLGNGGDEAGAAERLLASSEQDDDEGVSELSPDEVAAPDSGSLSWAVGVSFGRFDVLLATGERPMPPEPEPFDRLPVCSPGMLTGDDGLPLARPPVGYPIAFPEDGVLVDDAGHAHDLAAATRRVFDVVFGADADRWWSDLAAAIDPVRADLRRWLAGSFFEVHLKRYSRSRRKAPIYWQLATPSASYSVWLYAHRVTRDTFFQLQNDIVGPKLLHEEQRLAGLVERAGASPSAAARKEIAAQESFVEELRAMLDEIKRVAPLWNPDLDDGIVLVMAPLWRLVPQHKAWQKELKSKWDELVEGKYDWAHLAMHLWPERVVPKCATDRSLAIAHGLEDEFWAEGADGKWKPRPTPTRPVEDLVRERSSPAVRAALKSLLEAPPPAGSARRAGAGRRGAPA